jgi:DNA-binding NtrC family response regulator
MATAEIKRVLFVDDEPKVLEALRDRLRPLRHRWAMRFAEGPEEALRELAREPADVVVSDLKMPGIRGTTLLALVKAWHPSARRIVLSGHIRAEWSERHEHCAHAVLAKPCETDALVRAIEDDER